MPALFGFVWPDPSNLTVSLAPDGTQIAGASSSLHNLLDASMSREVWRYEIQRALQSWASVTNIDVRLVGDSGRAFGDPSGIQGSIRFGDIRIGARPLSTNAIAITNPPDFISGWAGEIILNSNYQFSKGGANGTIDLYSALLHEVGHALGLGNSSDPNSVRNNYTGAKLGLAEIDRAEIQQLYGVRAADQFDAKRDNNTIKTATQIEYAEVASQTLDSPTGKLGTPLQVSATINDGDVDMYKILIPSTLGAPIVSLNVAGVSMLQAKLSVLDANGKVVLQSTASTPGQSLTLTLKDLPRNQTYYIKVEGAGPAPFNIGSYRLAAGNALAIIWNDYNTAIKASGIDFEQNVNFADTIFMLGKIKDHGDARWDVVGRAQFRAQGEIDVFEISAGPKAGNTLLVTIWGDTVFMPQLMVTDRLGREIASEVLRADGFGKVIQVRNIDPNMKYQIRAWAGQYSGGLFNRLNYRFAADFRNVPINLSTVMQGEFTGAAFSATHEMVVTRSELFRFELTAGSVPVEFVIRNEQGQILHRFSLDQNHTQALDVLLQPGKYTLETRLKNGPSVVAGKTFRLRMADLSNPIGPVLLEPEEPTTQPKTSSTTNPESSTSSISKTTTKKADSRVAPEPVEYSYYEDPGYYWYTEPTTTIVDPNSSYESYDANLYPYTWYW